MIRNKYKNDLERSRSFFYHKNVAKGVRLMFMEYNPNPTGRRVEDCSIRALTKALDWDWEKAYAMACARGFSMGDMPHSNSVWGSILRENGFKRFAVPDTCPECYTAENFCDDHPEGIYVLGFGRHVATMVDGIVFDSWNSLDEIPQYYWTNREEG